MKKVKIIHVIPSLSKGGAERFIVDICNSLADHPENDVTILSLMDNEIEGSFLSDINTNVQYMSFSKKPGFDFRSLYKLTIWLRSNRPDVIHTHINAMEYIIPYTLINNGSTSFFHTIHNQADKECPYWIMKQVRKIFYKKNMIIPVTISKDGSTTYRYYYGLQNDVTIYNGRPLIAPSAEVESLKTIHATNSNEYLIVSIGRVVKEKNHILLISAIQELNKKNSSKYNLLIIGDFRDEALLNKLRDLVDQDTAIQLLGGKTNIIDYLHIADAFCLSSLHEGMPISLIEAFSIGCIPICTPVGGINEMISNGHNGFLTEDLTVQSMVKAFNHFSSTLDKDIISQNGKKTFLNKYHIEISAKNHMNIYKKRK